MYHLDQVPKCSLETVQQCENVVNKVSKQVAREECWEEPIETCKEVERKITSTRMEKKCETVYIDQC